MEEKKLFTEREIIESLASLYFEKFDIAKSCVKNIFRDTSYSCGYIDALISVYCYLFNTNHCPAYFGVDKGEEDEK